MTDFICPNCRGGFPEGPLDNGCCPWCGQSIDGSYEPPTVNAVTKVTQTDDDSNDRSRLSQMLIPD